MESVADPFENLATKKDLYRLESKLLHSYYELKNDLIKWMVGLSFIQVDGGFIVYSSGSLFERCTGIPCWLIT